MKGQKEWQREKSKNEKRLERRESNKGRTRIAMMKGWKISKNERLEWRQREKRFEYK